MLYILQWTTVVLAAIALAWNLRLWRKLRRQRRTTLRVGYHAAVLEALGRIVHYGEAPVAVLRGMSAQANHDNFNPCRMADHFAAEIVGETSNVVDGPWPA